MREKIFILVFIFLMKVSTFASDVFTFSVETQEINFDGDKINHNCVVHIFFAESLIKISLDDTISIIINKSNESVFYIDEKAKLYWELDFKKLREKNEEVAEEILKTLNHNFVKEEREKLAFFYFLFSGKKMEGFPEPEIRILNEEKEISGYKSKNFKVVINREIIFDCWYTTQIETSFKYAELLRAVAVFPDSVADFSKQENGFPVKGKLKCAIWGKRFIINFNLEKFGKQELKEDFFTLSQDYLKKDESELENIFIRRKE